MHSLWKQTYLMLCIFSYSCNLEGMDSSKLEVIEVEWRRRSRDSGLIPTGTSILGASEKLDLSADCILTPAFKDSNRSAIPLILCLEMLHCVIYLQTCS